MKYWMKYCMKYWKKYSSGYCKEYFKRASNRPHLAYLAVVCMKYCLSLDCLCKNFSSSWILLQIMNVKTACCAFSNGVVQDWNWTNVAAALFLLKPPGLWHQSPSMLGPNSQNRGVWSLKWQTFVWTGTDTTYVNYQAKSMWNNWTQRNSKHLKASRSISKQLNSCTSIWCTWCTLLTYWLNSSHVKATLCQSLLMSQNILIIANMAKS